MATTKITVNDNGSLKVEGDFEIVDKHGKNYGLGGRTALSISRCSHSKTNHFATDLTVVILNITQKLSIFPRRSEIG